MSRVRSIKSEMTNCGHGRRGSRCHNKAKWVVPTYTIIMCDRDDPVRLDRVRFFEKRLCDGHFLEFASRALQGVAIPLKNLVRG